MYFITLIDDYSQRTWIHFLKEKAEVLEKFKEFKEMMEKQSDYHIKVLRSDRDGEYTLKVLNNFNKQCGIIHQLTVVYTPQLNGIAEHRNHTILVIARNMLKSKYLPKTYWVEAVDCTVYLLNHCPTKSVKFNTPLEIWSSIKPSVSHLKVFGCIAYAHIPKQRRKKLDNRGEKYIFSGYERRTKAYKLYNPVTKKRSISRYAEFD